jgi:hypothetical protein
MLGEYATRLGLLTDTSLDDNSLTNRVVKTPRYWFRWLPGPDFTDD